MATDPFMMTSTDTPFALRDPAAAAALQSRGVHKYGSDVQHRCATDARGFPTPNDASISELRVDTHLGFVPLWARGQILRWRFNDASFGVFQDPEAAKQTTRQLMAAALDGWGDVAPIRFSEQRDLYDFEVVMLANTDCDANGCVLASSFFPGGGQHQLLIYPTFIQQSHDQKIQTLEHEFGHVFGLRHWFAAIAEAGMASTAFGNQSEFSIMNYGAQSLLTPADRGDLGALYQSVWNGSLSQINGTPVRLFQPYSSHY